MKLNDARRSIHDAFAIQMTQPDPFTVGSGTKFDNTAQIFNGVQAGRIISAVMNQQPAYRGVAMLMNGPDQIVSPKDFDSMNILLFQRFMKRYTPDPRAAGEIHAVIDRLIHRHKIAVWNHETEKLSVSRIAAMIAHTAKARARVARYAGNYLDVLTEVDNASLAPVWAVIKEHRESLREAAKDGGHLRAVS